MLYIFSGLPGVGKTTIARLLVPKVDAVYLRIDTIEFTLVSGGIDKADIKGLGYEIAYALAAENLSLGRNVCSDCVNPWEMTRDAWRSAANHCGAEFIDIEVICSNLDQHRTRVEGRDTDLPVHLRPSWQDVMTRDYHPHQKPVLQLDTAMMSAEEAVQAILARSSR